MIEISWVGCCLILSMNLSIPKKKWIWWILRIFCADDGGCRPRLFGGRTNAIGDRPWVSTGFIYLRGDIYFPVKLIKFFVLWSIAFDFTEFFVGPVNSLPLNAGCVHYLMLTCVPWVLRCLLWWEYKKAPPFYNSWPSYKIYPRMIFS